MASVRFLIVDDSEAWRRMVVTMLQQLSDVQVLDEASDGLEAVQKSEELQPDVILLDVGLPKLNGLEAARRIREISPLSRILFLSENNCREVISEAFTIGAAGYVVKSDAPRDLLVAVQAVISGKPFVSSRFVGHVTGRDPDAEDPS